MQRIQRFNRRAFIGGISGLAALGAIPARGATTATVRVGSVPVQTYMQPYYGNAAHIFQNAGIDLQITGLANSGAIVAALLGGSLDVGIGSPTGIAQARLHGVPLKIFGPGGMYSVDMPSMSQLMVAKDSPIKKMSDLTGKTIATDLLKSVPQIGTILWLQKSGVDPASIRWLELPFGSMRAALERGQIDAATVSEPALSAARSTCRGLGDFNSAIAPHYFISAWFSTESWLNANLDLAHTLVHAIEATSLWSSQHFAESLDILEQYSKLPHDVLVHMGRSTFGTKLDSAMIEAPVQAAYKTGMTTGTVPPNELIATGFADS
jgi:NitT/TauT family transport system substrate-binding protein